jgi:dihydroxyacetone kinase-like predicted kinase
LDGVQVENGNILGLAEGQVCSAGLDLFKVTLDTLRQMQVEQRELLTIYFGADSSEKEAEQLAGRVEEWCPDLEIEIVAGGQPHYFFILGAE